VSLKPTNKLHGLLNKRFQIYMLKKDNKTKGSKFLKDQGI
jgi:hypothetical protein